MTSPWSSGGRRLRTTALRKWSKASSHLALGPAFLSPPPSLSLLHSLPFSFCMFVSKQETGKAKESKLHAVSTPLYQRVHQTQPSACIRSYSTVRVSRSTVRLLYIYHSACMYHNMYRCLCCCTHIQTQTRRRRCTHAATCIRTRTHVRARTRTRTRTHSIPLTNAQAQAHLRPGRREHTHSLIH